MPCPVEPFDGQGYAARATDADLDELRTRSAEARLPETEAVYRAEFIDVVDELADSNDADAPACHAVAPSVPDFGPSDDSPRVGSRYRRTVAGHRRESPAAGGSGHFVADLGEGRTAVLAAAGR